MTSNDRECAVCHRQYAARDLVPGALVRPTVAQLILEDCPDWSSNTFICHADLARYRTSYVQSILEAERGEITSLEQEVLQSLQQHELLSTDVDAEFEQAWSRPERLADDVAAFGGSWRFLIIFGVLLAAWIVVNSLVVYWRPVDPYPFILLNLILSCLAAIQAPLIMMSQRRQEAKDRARARHDYQVNLKAELEIRHLNEKMDHLLSRQWERLMVIQKMQLELLAEIDRH